MRIILLLLFVVTHTLDAKIALLRAPRSGSHWFLYCCNTLFQRTTYTDRTLHAKGDAAKEAIYTAHNPNDLKLKPNRDQLILLVRNHRECLLREYHCSANVIAEIKAQAARTPHKHQILTHWENDYFHNFLAFERFAPKNRLLIYYEDLMTSPSQTLTKVAHFLGETTEEIADFTANIEEHQNNCLKRYEKNYTSHTRGKSLLHHTHKHGIAASRQIDRETKRLFPKISNRYLKRYFLP